MDLTHAAAFADQLEKTAAWLNAAAGRFGDASDRLDRATVAGTWNGRARTGFQNTLNAAKSVAIADAVVIRSAASALSNMAISARIQSRTAHDLLTMSQSPDPAVSSAAAAHLPVQTQALAVMEQAAVAVLSRIVGEGARLIQASGTTPQIAAAMAVAGGASSADARALILSLARDGQGHLLAAQDPYLLGLALAQMTPTQRQEVLDSLGNSGAKLEAGGVVTLLDAVGGMVSEADLALVFAALAANPLGLRSVAWAGVRLGFQEGNNNDQPFAGMVGHANNAAWCATFTVAAAGAAGAALPIGANNAWTVAQREAFIAQDAWFDAVPGAADAGAQPGDLAYFKFAGRGNVVNHVGIVIAPLGGGRLLTIDGNTSARGTTEAGGADGVNLHVRDQDIVGYGRPRADGQTEPGAWGVPELYLGG